MLDNVYCWMVRRTRRRCENVVRDQVGWAEEASSKDAVTWEGVIEGTSPRKARVEGFQHWIEEGRLTSLRFPGTAVSEGREDARKSGRSSARRGVMSGGFFNKNSGRREREGRRERRERREERRPRRAKRGRREEERRGARRKDVKDMACGVILLILLGVSLEFAG